MRLDNPYRPANHWPLIILAAVTVGSLLLGLPTIFYCTAPILALALLATLINALLPRRPQQDDPTQDRPTTLP